MGTFGRVILTYEELEIKTPATKIAGTLEFLEGESTKTIDISFINHDDATYSFPYPYPKLYSVSLNTVFLLDDIRIENISRALINQANGILPKLATKTAIYIKIIDDKSVIEFSQNSLEISTSFGHYLSHVINLNLTHIRDFEVNSTIKGLLQIVRLLH